MAGSSVRLAMVMVVVLAVLGLSSMVSGHALEFGQCKSKPGDRNFVPDQLTGFWYVIKVFSSDNKCMTMNFKRTPEGFEGTESMEVGWARSLGIDHVLSETGLYTIKDKAHPAVMRVRWPSNVLMVNADVTVIDINPTSFAVLYECQSLFLAKRTSAIILSRQPTLEHRVVQRIEQDLSAMDINVNDFDVMTHQNCNKAGDGDYNINVNDYIGKGLPRIVD